MGRAPCCDKANVKRGPWSPEEDRVLRNYIHNNGTGENWIALPKKAGLRRCGKSCRLRWLNYLRPGIKHGSFTEEEDHIISTLYHSLGSKWSVIASKLPGRTDNDIKNYWNTKLKKKSKQTSNTTTSTKTGPSTLTPKPESNISSVTTDSSLDPILSPELTSFPIPNMSWPTLDMPSTLTNAHVAWPTPDVPDASNGYMVRPENSGVDEFLMNMEFGASYDLFALHGFDEYLLSGEELGCNRKQHGIFNNTMYTW